jgi:hypothetical protein
MISVWDVGKNQARLSPLAYPAKHPPAVGGGDLLGSMFLPPSNFQQWAAIQRELFSERTNRECC